jgi:hypothetical protein
MGFRSLLVCGYVSRPAPEGLPDGRPAVGRGGAPRSSLAPAQRPPTSLNIGEARLTLANLTIKNGAPFTLSGP